MSPLLSLLLGRADSSAASRVEPNLMTCARGIQEQSEFAVQRAPWPSALLTLWGEAEPVSVLCFAFYPDFVFFSDVSTMNMHGALVHSH